MNAVQTARRWRWSALVLLATACGPAPGGSADADAGTVAAAPRAAGADADYAGCRAHADGAGPALRACADRELARIAATLPARGDAAAAHAVALRALGDDALARGVFGGGEAAAVAVADAAVTTSRARAAWLNGGAAPAGRADARALGAAARAAWERSRAATCAAVTPADCAARYDALLAPYLPRPEPDRMTDATPATGLPLPDCAAVKASGLVGGALGDAFYERYPKELADPARVEGVALDDAAIGNVVGYLACVAALTDGDPVVADNAAALFHSPRHGRAAFARLAAMPEAARFLAQMQAYSADR